MASESVSPLTVSQVNARVKALLENEPLFRQVDVAGELGGVTLHRSGHLYFTLKDAQSELAAVMYRSQLQRSPFQSFATGDRVIALGSLTVYEPRGRYQLLVNRLVPDGVGALHAQLQRLKAALEAEGLFDPGRKRPLPPHPRQIAVITSPTGAVWHDIRTTLTRRGARLRVLLLPATVQGEGALPSLLAALAQAAGTPGTEIVVLARGGGSLEDLWCFNEAPLVRAIAACPVPVLSAIGHETDVTLADLAADLRAPTPTAAAELVFPNLEVLLGELAYHRATQARALRYRLDAAWDRLGHQTATLKRLYTTGRHQTREYLRYWAVQLAQTGGFLRHRERAELALLAARLHALDPGAPLRQGYTRTEVNGRPLRRVADAPPGTRLITYVEDGAVHAEVRDFGE